MAARISITTSRESQSEAASCLSEQLTRMNCPHAYIGGFAWSCLGSNRPTEDIDVLIDTKNFDIRALRQQILESHVQFAQAALKIYYVPEQIGDLRDEQLLYASEGSVLIETLQTGKLGLPITPEPVFEIPTESGQSIPILHPSVLILTKLKRWSYNHESTRPKTVSKNKSDQKDINFLLNWLANHEMTMAFEDYKGKTKDDLLAYVRQYRDKFQADVELMEVLKSTMRPDDWEALGSNGASLRSLYDDLESHRPVFSS